MKEPYIKPAVKSDILEPEALTGGGSGIGNGGGGACPPDSNGGFTCPDGCSVGICR